VETFAGKGNIPIDCRNSGIKADKLVVLAKQWLNVNGVC